MLKDALRPLLPLPMLRLWRRRAAARLDRRFANWTPAEVFGAVYRERLWGSRPDFQFCSGNGSHERAIIEPYLASVRAFLSELPRPLDAVDLGCGDFNVGARLRDRCAAFVAADVVPELITRNARAFAHLDVTFQCIDLVKDELPAGQVAFLRQVLQHLGNAQIAAVIAKLYRYEWLIVSEHVPETGRFIANRDKPMGPGVRERFGSGVVLTAPPFNLNVLEQRELCTVPEQSGRVRTMAYRLHRFPCVRAEAKLA
jgi:hypothetical protein